MLESSTWDFSHNSKVSLAPGVKPSMFEQINYSKSNDLSPKNI